MPRAKTRAAKGRQLKETRRAIMSGLAPLTEAEVKAFVDDWYLDNLDSHAPVEDILPLVADEGLEMVLPETTLHGVGHFRDWYDRIINTFFDEVHTIKE